MKYKKEKSEKGTESLIFRYKSHDIKKRKKI